MNLAKISISVCKIFSGISLTIFRKIYYRSVFILVIFTQDQGLLTMSTIPGLFQNPDTYI